MSIFAEQNNLRTLALGILRSISHFAIRHPIRVLVLAMIITLGATPSMFRLRLRTDAHALVPKDAPEVLYDRSVRERFGIEVEEEVQYVG